MRPLLANWILVLLWVVLRPGNEVEVADINAKRRRCKLQLASGFRDNAVQEFGFLLNLANVRFFIFDSHQRWFCFRFQILFVVCCM